MSRRRTAILLGAFAGELVGRLERNRKRHPNQTDSAAAALAVVASTDRLSNARLGAALRLSHSATVRLVDKLEANGLVKCRRAVDKRVVMIEATKRGRKRARAIIDDRRDAIVELLQPLKKRDRRRLARSLEKLLAALGPSPADARHICRFCDTAACPPERCPLVKIGV